MNRSEKLQWARISSLIGGSLILVGSLLVLLAVFAFTAAFPFRNVGGPESLIVFGIAAFFLIYLLANLAMGIATVMGALRLETPGGRGWAMVILVCGGLSFFTFGGLFIGSVLAIVGGALALSAHSEQPPAATRETWPPPPPTGP